MCYFTSLRSQGSHQCLFRHPYLQLENSAVTGGFSLTRDPLTETVFAFLPNGSVFQIGYGAGCLGGFQCSNGIGYPCPAGFYCPLGSSALACTQYHYCPAGSAAPLDCPAGRYCVGKA